MSATGGGSGQINVSTITAQYKIDASGAQAQIGQISQQAQAIKNAFGNVTFRLDASQAMGATADMIRAATEAKQAYALAQQSLADYRNAMTATQQTTQQVRAAQLAANQTIGQTRVVQQQTAQATQQATAAMQAQNLATATQRTNAAAAAAATAQLRTQVAAIALANAQAAQAANTANTAHQNWLQTISQWIVNGAAFRAGQQLMTQAINDFRAAIIGTIGDAIQWQKLIIQIQSNTTMTTGETRAMDQAIRTMGAGTAAPLAQLAQGYRVAANEGFNVADATKIVNEAQMSGVTTGSNVTQTTNILASVMHEFGIQADGAAGAMNVLHLASALGNTTLEEFVASGGRAFATAASLGISLPEVTSAMAALTREGYNAFQATTIVSDIIGHISAPSDQAKKTILELSKATGVNLVYDFSLAGLQAKGLSGVLDDVAEVARRTGDESINFKLIPALRGGRGELVLTTQGAGDFKNILQQTNDTLAGKTDPTLQAWNATVNTAAFQIGVLKNEVKLFEIGLGEQLLPVIKEIVQWMQQLLRSMGIDFQIPGIKDAKPATEQLTTATQGAIVAQRELGVAAKLDKSEAILAASRAMDDFKEKTAEADSAIRGLTADGNDLKTKMDGVKEAIAAANEKYGPTIKGDERKIASIEMLTPEEFKRHIDELNLSQQEIQLKLAKPDTTVYTTAINDLRQKLDDLGDANTAAVDARIDSLQKKMRALGAIATVGIDKTITSLRAQLEAIGDTKDLDRKIEDIQAQLQAPDQSTAAQEGAMAGLTSQFAGGQISGATFDASYGALARQKQAIVENNTLRKTALQQQLELLQQDRTEEKRAQEDKKAALDIQIKQLESQKATIEETNREQRDATQRQLDDAQDERKRINDQHDKDRKALEDAIRVQERAKSNATAEYDSKMAVITAQKEHNDLLDNAARITRDIAEYPLKQEIDSYKNALADALEPLNKSRDDYQALINKNQEDIAYWREKKTAIAAANEEAKKALTPPYTNVGPPEGSKGGPSLTSGGISPYINKYDEFGQLMTQPQNTVVLDKIREFGAWWEAHGAMVKLALEGMAVALGVLGIIVAPGAALFVGLSTIVGFFIWDYETNPTFRKYIDAVAASFLTLKDKIADASTALLDWLGISKTGSDPSLIKEDPNHPGANLGLQPGDRDKFGNPTASAPDATWLEKHFGTGSAIDRFFGNIGDKFDAFGTKIHDILGQGSPAQQDMTDFDTHTATVIGPNGNIIRNIGIVKDALSRWLGGGGDLSQNLGTARANFTSQFGPSGIPSIVTAFGQNIGLVLGKGGTLDQYIATGGTVPTALLGLQTTFQQYFGTDAAGTSAFLRNPVTGFAGFVGSAFGPDGSLKTIFSTNFPPVLTQLLGIFGAHFGTDGQGLRQPVEGFGTFIQHMFGQGGPLSQYVGAFGSILDGVMPSDIAPLQGFLNSVGQAIHSIGALFHIPELADFPIPNVGYVSGAGGGGGIIGSGHAAGLIDSARGHMAMVGERGPELMFVPQHATIIPNHLLPGHADGYNLTNFSLPGLFASIAPVLFNDATQGIAALAAKFAPRSSGGAAGTAAGGFHDMAMDAFMAYMAAYGGPVDTTDAFNALEQVGRERGVDPRWLMAVMQTETAYGNTAGRLAPFWNFGGMGVNDRGYSFDSGVQATDSSMHFAAYASLHDFLEDIAIWIDQNGTSFKSYDGSGVEKNNTYRELLRAIPIVGEAGLAGATGSNQVTMEGSMLGSQLLALAESNLAGTFGWCEQYVGDVMLNLAHLRYHRAGSAEEHAWEQPLNPGLGPTGAIVFFPDSSGLGHVAFSMGDGHTVWGTRRGGTDRAQVGKLDVTGWEPYGWTDNPAYNGGWITEPTLTLGMYSGKKGTLGERGIEQVTANYDIPQGVGGGAFKVDVSFDGATFNVGAGGDAKQFGQDLGDAMSDRILSKLRSAGKQV